MHDVRKVDVMENILDENDHIAEHIKEHMRQHGIMVINEMGSPGAGKTTVLKNLIQNLNDMKTFVIEGDIESDIDTVALQDMGIQAVQINTFGACHLDAPMIDHTLDHMDFGQGPHHDHDQDHDHHHHHDHDHDHPHHHDQHQDGNHPHHHDIQQPVEGILYIENVGNLVCPAEFSIGEHVKMLISTVTEGSDKPYKYPLAFEKADVIVLNKVDLIPHLDFDEAFFMKGVRALNKEVPVFKVSHKTGEGYPQLAQWIREKARSL